MSTLSLALAIQLGALGLLTGVLAGLLGIGGGMVMVPALTYLLSHRGVDGGLAVKMAIATSMATIVFTSLASVRAHHRRGAVRWSLVGRLAPGVVAGAAVSSLGVFAAVKGAALALVFAAFVAFSAVQMLLDPKPHPGRTMPGPAGQVAAGGAIGFVSGLVGAGGGFLSVPFLTWSNVAMHNAVATSAALGLPIALSNVVGYSLAGRHVAELPQGSLGYIWMPALALLAIPSVVTAPWGARLAHALPVAKLKRVFAGILVALALYMTWRGISG